MKKSFTQRVIEAVTRYKVEVLAVLVAIAACVYFFVKTGGIR